MTRGHAASAELAESRRLMEEHAVTPSPDDATVHQLDADGMEVLHIVPPHAPGDSAVLYFHGGAFRRGSPRVFAPQLARLAGGAGGTQIFAVKYSLAPENPFPAGLDDALRAYQWLLKSYNADRVIVWGDSAGGGIAAALLLRIAAVGLPRPRGAVLFSPWVDLRMTGSSIAENEATDKLFAPATAAEAAADYLDGHDAADPFVSPALGDWKGQPPLLVFVSDIEILRDDAVLLATNAINAGVWVKLQRAAQTQHIWPVLDYPRTPESVQAVQTVREFMTNLLGPASSHVDGASVGRNSLRY